MNQQLRIAEMLCTRLCHDLTGPIGAIANGVEFLTENEEKIHDQAIELISSSATQGVVRLQFYRKAFGGIKENGEADIEELQKLIIAFFSDGKISIDWSEIYTNNSNLSLSQRMSKLIINLLIIMSSVLIRGGKISININQSELTNEISILGTGKSIKWEKESENVLIGNVSFESLTPKTIQLYITHLLAEQLGVSLLCKLENDSFEIVARRKPE